MRRNQVSETAAEAGVERRPAWLLHCSGMARPGILPAQPSRHLHVLYLSSWLLSNVVGRRRFGAQEIGYFRRLRSAGTGCKCHDRAILCGAAVMDRFAQKAGAFVSTRRASFVHASMKPSSGIFHMVGYRDHGVSGRRLPLGPVFCAARKARNAGTGARSSMESRT